MSLSPIAKEMLDIANDLDLVVEEEIHKLPPCEGETHPRGLNGHVPEQSAAYMLVMPCGFDMLMCAGWVNAPVPDGYDGQVVDCDLFGGCGEEHDWDDISFIPLNLRD